VDRNKPINGHYYKREEYNGKMSYTSRRGSSLYWDGDNGHGTIHGGTECHHHDNTDKPPTTGWTTHGGSPTNIRIVYMDVFRVDACQDEDRNKPINGHYRERKEEDGKMPHTSGRVPSIYWDGGNGYWAMHGGSECRHYDDTDRTPTTG
jgi:hypothetical protein